MNYQNVSGVPGTCVESKTKNQNTNLQTVYNSKCNDHLTPIVHDSSNSVNGIKSDTSWSNVRGFGNIQQATCDNTLTAHPWNRLTNLNVKKDSPCA